jgi:hypothetical protein
MTTISPPRPTPTTRHRPATLALGLAIVWFATHGPGGPPPTGGLGSSDGCDGGKGLHLAAAGGGVGVLGLRACGELAPTAARSGDDVFRAAGRVDGLDVLGARASRHLPPGQVLPATDTLHALADDSWTETAALVGRQAVIEGRVELSSLPSTAARYPHLLDLPPAALEAYARQTEGLWEDIGAEIYLLRPDTWSSLGGDDLLALAVDTSPRLRDEVAQAATPRFVDAAARHDAGASAEEVLQATGVRITTTAHQRILELTTEVGPIVGRQLLTLPTDALDVEFVGLGDPGDPRDRAERAERWLSAQGTFGSPLSHLDVGLYSAMLTLEGVVWVGPGPELLKGGEPRTTQRLLDYLGAGRRPVDAQVMSELWPALLEGHPTSGRQPAATQARASEVDDGVRYQATYREHPLVDIVVHPDGTHRPGREPVSPPTEPRP